ncbi:rRNA-processing protein bfr2 [Kickxella alabastrina]|nr:rRNA-processing protein bfr2 [Kickxella alabastrina]
MPKATKRSKSLLEQIADMTDPRPKDLDIENDGINDNAYIGSDSDSEESEDEDLKREHYVSVGKSKIRQNQGIGELGPKYMGSRISRKDLYEGQGISEDEEDGVQLDSEDDDDEELASDDADDSDDSDDELPTQKKGTASSDDSDSESDEERMGVFGAGSDGEDISAESRNRIRDEIKKLEDGEKALLKTITQTARSDIEKGKHVLNQTRMWEGALDARIRMQKLVTAANELPRPDLFSEIVAQVADSEDADERLEGARLSVQQLLGSLIELRQTLAAQNNAVKQAQTGSKRPAQDDGDDLETSWGELEELRDSFHGFRDASLEKWSNRVQVSASINATKKFKAVNQGIIHQIDQALAAKERLVERTQLKRTEYTVIGELVQEPATEKNAAVDAHLRDLDVEIFDDSDFYQQLLRELIESRMVDSNDPTASLGTRWAAVNQQSRIKKRVVDTRASKGRKIRYHVMEKLQNFMPPIPTGTWHEDMVNELFSSLLGQRVPQSILDAESESLATQTNDISADIKGLRLFG